MYYWRKRTDGKEVKKKKMKTRRKKESMEWFVV